MTFTIANKYYNANNLYTGEWRFIHVPTRVAKGRSWWQYFSNIEQSFSKISLYQKL